MDRLERLINLVAALLDAGRPLSREELRERVGGYSEDVNAFRRNFERDKDALRQMGMPLALEPLEGDHPDAPTGYRVPRERYELPDLGLTEDELTALRFAASAVQISGGEGATASALRKLAAGIAPTRPGDTTTGARDATTRTRDATTSPGDVPTGPEDTTPPGEAPAGPESAPAVPAARHSGGSPVAEVPGGEAVAVVFGAISERRRLSFGYRGLRRTVDPWKLAYRSGQWYLSGYDHERKAERVFRLDRVDGAVAAVGDAGAFARPQAAAALPLPPWQLGDGPSIDVQLLVDDVVAPTAIAAVGEEAVVERRPDGSVVLSLAVTNRPALQSFVLGYLDRAEILGPVEIRQAFVSALEALVAR